VLGYLCLDLPESLGAKGSRYPSSMARGRDGDDMEGAESPRLSLGDRLKQALLKPADPDAPPSKARSSIPESVEEIEAALRTVTDKERMIGLAAAPVAALIGLIVSNNLIDTAKVHHTSYSVYQELTFVLLGLAVLMLAAAWYRKRLYLGIVMVSIGLTFFNLHYWEFGVPFILGAAWYLMQSFRLQRALREATGDLPGRGRGTKKANGTRPSTNKRYTPPTTKRSSRPKLEGEQP
jgi:hypothetical protein